MPKVSSCLYLCLCSAGLPKENGSKPTAPRSAPVVAGVAHRHAGRRRQVIPRPDDDPPSLPTAAAADADADACLPLKTDFSPCRLDLVVPRKNCSVSPSPPPCRRHGDDEAWQFPVVVPHRDDDDIRRPSCDKNEGPAGRLNRSGAVTLVIANRANPSVHSNIGPRNDGDTSDSSDGISPRDDAGYVNCDVANRSADDADPTIDGISPTDEDIGNISDDISPSDDDDDSDDNDDGHMSDGTIPSSEDAGQMNVDKAVRSIDCISPSNNDVINPNSDNTNPKNDNISPNSEDASLMYDGFSPNNDNADRMNDDVSLSIRDADPNNDSISPSNDADDSQMINDPSPSKGDAIPGTCDLISSDDGIVSGNDDASLLPGLPDDVAMLCLGRVARSCLASLPLVCHSWRQLCLSPEYPRLRLQVGSSESWIYVLTEIPTDAPFKAFNPQTNKWYDLPPTPGRSMEKSWEGFACVAVGPLLLLMGGVYGTLDPNTRMFTRESVTADVKIYNACTNQWSSGASMNTPRSWFAASVVEDRVYVAGGQGRTCFLSSAEVYDPRKNEWSPIPGMISVRSSCYGATLDNHFWVVGGEYMRNQYGERPEKGSAEVYDPESCSWKLVPEMWLDSDKVPGPNTLYEDQLLFVHRSKLMLYSKETNDWSHIGSLHNGIRSDCSRYGFACENIEGNIYIIGGNLEYRGYNFRNYVLPISSVEMCNLRSQGQSKFLRWNNLAGMSNAEGAVLASAVVRI